MDLKTIQDPYRFYIYAFLREKDSNIAEKGTPYIIGKGSGDRCYKKHGRPAQPPSNRDSIIKLVENLPEEEAFTYEMAYIEYYGRIDIGTGILRNRSNGGDGSSGKVCSAETRKSISDTLKLRYATGNKHPTLGRSHSTHTKKIMSKQRKGEKNVNAKLNEVDVGDIKYRLSIGQSGASIARLYNVTHANISAIKTEKTWAHVPITK
jgi:hypothetical protein